MRFKLLIDDIPGVIINFCMDDFLHLRQYALTIFHISKYYRLFRRELPTNLRNEIMSQFPNFVLVNFPEVLECVINIPFHTAFSWNKTPVNTAS